MEVIKMAKDMYKKRKERKEKKIMENNNENKTNINWYIPPYGKSY